MNLIGEVLAGRYEILEEIGVGGMAVVYKARCKVLNRYVAIKVLREDLQNDAEFIKRFNVEAQAAASLAHSNIVSVYDVGSEGDIHYIVMEYVEGETLKEYIDINKSLPWREAVDIAMQICKGLEVAHKNSIVHRDIKPHNIMRTPDGVIKVTDFGIARANFQKTMTVEDSAIGSVHYVSPEQARGGFIDQRTDIYSLGIVLYEMLTGRVPFDNESPVTIAIKHLQEKPVPPSELNISIPRPLELAVLKAIEKEPSARYSTVTEFCGDLSDILNDPERRIRSQVAEDIDQTRIYKPVETEREENENGEGTACENAETEEDMNKTKTKKKPVKIDKNKERKVVALAIAASFVVIAIILFAFASLVGITDMFFGGGGNVEIPNLVDMTYEEAVEMYGESGFNIVIGKEVESEKESGTVLAQDPEAGKKIKQSEDMVITVDVSAGSGEIILESYLKYTDRRNVEIEMRKYGLVSEFIEEASDTIPEGAVIRQVPKAGVSVEKGDTVTFFVSTGPAKDKKDDEDETVTDKKEEDKKPSGGDASGTGANQTEPENQGGETKAPEVQKKSSMLTVYGPKDKESALVQVKVNGNVVYSKNIANGSSEVVKLESTQSSVEVEILYDGVSKQKSTVSLH